MATDGIRGNISVSQKVTTNYDMSLGDSNFQIKEPVETFTMVSIQASWDSRTGTASPTSAVTMEMSNNGTDWEDAGLSAVIDASTGSEILIDDAFACKFLRAVFTQGSTTGGNLNIEIVAKD